MSYNFVTGLSVVQERDGESESEGRGVIIIRNEARRMIRTAGPADLVATATPTHSFALQMSNYIQLDY